LEKREIYNNHNQKDEEYSNRSRRSTSREYYDARDSSYDKSKSSYKRSVHRSTVTNSYRSPRPYTRSPSSNSDSKRRRLDFSPSREEKSKILSKSSPVKTMLPENKIEKKIHHIEDEPKPIRITEPIEKSEKTETPKPAKKITPVKSISDIEECKPVEKAPSIEIIESASNSPVIISECAAPSTDDAAPIEIIDLNSDSNDSNQTTCVNIEVPFSCEFMLEFAKQFAQKFSERFIQEHETTLTNAFNTQQQETK